jgi:zinc protease
MRDFKQFNFQIWTIALTVIVLWICPVLIAGAGAQAETLLSPEKTGSGGGATSTQATIPSPAVNRYTSYPPTTPAKVAPSTVPSGVAHSASPSPIAPASPHVPNRFNLTLPQEHGCPNGLRILILEDHTFPVVSCLMWYRVGSRNELPGMTGLSHLVEHLLFKNIGSFKKNQLAATIVANGGQFNGFTSEDFTAFYTTLPANKFELAVRGEAERIRGAKFTKPDVVVEVSNLTRELDEETKDPVALLSREVHATAFEQHPYRNPPAGWRNDLERLSYDDARWFYDRYYHPDNATIVLVGDLTPSTALAVVKKYFAVVPKSTHPFPVPRVQERFPIAEKRVLMKTPGKKEAVVVAYHAPSSSDPDAPVIAILEKLLNSQISGRLRKQLVEPKFCSSAQAVYELKRDPSLFTINLTALAGSSPAKVLEVTDGLIAQLRNQGISDSELTRAKRQAEFEFFNEADGPYRTGFHLGMFESLLNWQEDYVWPDKLRKVTVNDVRRVANHYLINDARVVGMLTSTAAAPPVPKTTAPNTTGQIETNDKPRALLQSSNSPMNIAGTATIALGNETTSSPFSPSIRAAHYKADDSWPTPFYIAQSAKTMTPFNLEKLAPTTITTPAAKASANSSTEASAPPHSIVTASGVTLKTTRSGISVIVIESHLNPLVQILGSIKAGSVFDPPDKKGLSSLLGTLLNYGSNKYARQQMISDQDDMGLPPPAMIHFESGLDDITVQTRCLSPDLFTQLSRIASSLKDPRFSDADLEKARQDLLNSIPQSDDAIVSKVQRALLRSLVVANSKFVPPDPNEKARTLNNLKLNDVHDFYSSCVMPKSTTLIIAGDVNPTQVFSVVESVFDGWNSAKPPLKFPSLASELGARERHGIKSSIPLGDKSQSFVCLGRIVPLTSNESEDKLWSHLLLADCALTNHPIFSHINHRLEIEPGLTGSVSKNFLTSHIETFPDASIWSLLLPMESANESNAVQAIQTELTKFTKSGLTQEELIESKRYLLGYILVSQMANLDTLSRTTLESFEQRDELSPLVKTSAAIRSATLDSVNRFVANNFKPDQAAVVVVGNKQLIRQVHPTSKAESAPQEK